MSLGVSPQWHMSIPDLIKIRPTILEFIHTGLVRDGQTRSALYACASCKERITLSSNGNSRPLLLETVKCNFRRGMIYYP
jgi:hypothetical protein